MEEHHGRAQEALRDRAPGEEQGGRESLERYLIGLGFALLLTIASFWAAQTQEVWGPGIPILLGVLAIGQMGVHLVYFLHISSAPDQTNNFLALAFGVFVVGLVVFGSMIIMSNLNTNMMPLAKQIEMQR
jgi:cytochrome o ubiquinol oxidase subunit IV